MFKKAVFTCRYSWKSSHTEVGPFNKMERLTINRVPRIRKIGLSTIMPAQVEQSDTKSCAKVEKEVENGEAM